MFWSFLFACFDLAESAKMLSNLFSIILFLLVSSCSGREVHAECGSVKGCESHKYQYTEYCACRGECI